MIVLIATQSVTAAETLTIACSTTRKTLMLANIICGRNAQDMKAPKNITRMMLNETFNLADLVAGCEHVWIR